MVTLISSAVFDRQHSELKNRRRRADLVGKKATGKQLLVVYNKQDKRHKRFSYRLSYGADYHLVSMLRIAILEEQKWKME